MTNPPKKDITSEEPQNAHSSSSVNAQDLTRSLLFLRWHLILDVSYKGDPHLRGIISA